MTTVLASRDDHNARYKWDCQNPNCSWEFHIPYFFRPSVTFKTNGCPKCKGDIKLISDLPKYTVANEPF